jgi:hypothetical protein
MTDISSTSQGVISQAINQLNKTAATSELSKQGIEVLVKHLSGNVLSLQKSSGLLAKTALLNNPEIRGKLTEGQPHQVKVTITADTPTQATLDFFSALSKKTSTLISLTEQQLQMLLKLPARQIAVSAEQTKTAIPQKLPILNATVLPSLPKTTTNFSTYTNPDNSRSTNQLKTEAYGQANIQQQNHIKLSITSQHPPIEINLPMKQLGSFIPGDKVSVELIPKGINWQVKIATTKPDVASVRINNQLNSNLLNNSVTSSTKAGHTTLAQVNIKNTSNLEVSHLKTQQSLITPQVAAPLIKVSIQEQIPTKPLNIEVTTKTVLQVLGKTPSEQNQQLSHTIQSTQADKLTLQIKPNGSANLLVQNLMPIASIPINRDIAQALLPLKLPNQQTVLSNINSNIENSKLTNNLPLAKDSHSNQTSLDLGKTTNIDGKVISSTNNQTTDTPNKQQKTNTQGLENAPKVTNPKDTMLEANNQLQRVLRDNPTIQSLITPTLLANKTDQANIVQSLLRAVQAKAEIPANMLQSINKAMLDPEFFKDAIDKPTKQIIEQITQQIRQALPQGKENDASQIRQLLNAPALNLSSVQMVSPTANQGMLAGLVTLLQMSLSARLMRTQTNRTEGIVGALNSVLSNRNANAGSSATTPKTLTDLSQLEQKHQLMREIGRLLAGHQTNKLSNAEQLLQGQESIYYNLPSAMGGIIKNVELLIKREQQSKGKDSEPAPENKTWQLTMKLSVGEMGELLTKAKLRPDNLEIDFYASNEEVKIQVMNYLPLLRKKLESLGIEVSKSQCQLGKIPDTLQVRPHHVFQAKA